MFAVLSGWFTAPEYLSPDEAYDLAKARFKTREGSIDGVPYVCMSDDLRGIAFAVPAHLASMLDGAFRRYWKDWHEQITH
jgi:hypothetical protein